MDSVAYLPISLASALRRDLDVTANNIANADTTGFRRERVAFESYLQETQGLGAEADVAFVVDGGSFVDEAQGALVQTGNPLDVALQGEGWFGYDTADGARAYGRDGRLTLDPQGNLVTQAGAQLLDAGGAPMALPPGDVNAISIAKDGTVTGPDGAVVGRIGIFEVPDIQSYERRGAGMFVSADPAAATPVAPAEGAAMVQGAVEGSNVQPVVEMTRLMDIQRSYERAMKLVSTEDDLRRDALSRLGRSMT